MTADADLKPIATPQSGDMQAPEQFARRRALRAALWGIVAVMTVAWLFVGDGLSAVLGMFGRDRPATTAEVGQAAPELRLPLAGGGDVDLPAYRGKVVLLNFWATWCVPCRAEMPAIEQVYQTHSERGFEVLAVNVSEREQDVIPFLHEVGVTFPSALDRTGEVARRFRAIGLPTTFLIDRSGVIRDVRVGPFTEQMLEERLEKLL